MQPRGNRPSSPPAPAGPAPVPPPVARPPVDEVPVTQIRMGAAGGPRPDRPADEGDVPVLSRVSAAFGPDSYDDPPLARSTGGGSRPPADRAEPDGPDDHLPDNHDPDEDAPAGVDDPSPADGSDLTVAHVARRGAGEVDEDIDDRHDDDHGDSARDGGADASADDAELTVAGLAIGAPDPKRDPDRAAMPRPYASRDRVPPVVSRTRRPEPVDGPALKGRRKALDGLEAVDAGPAVNPLVRPDPPARPDQSLRPDPVPREKRAPGGDRPAWGGRAADDDVRELQVPIPARDQPPQARRPRDLPALGDDSAAWPTAARRPAPVVPAAAGQLTDLLGPVLMVVAGLAVAIGSFLKWSTLTSGGDIRTFNGIEIGDGRLTVVAAIALIAIGSGRLTGWWAGRGVGAAGFAAGGALVLISLADLVAGPATLSSFRRLSGSKIEIAAGFGLYLTVASALVALIGGALMVWSDLGLADEEADRFPPDWDGWDEGSRGARR